MPVYIPTKDDIIRSLEVQLRLKDEHVAHLNEQIAGLREQLADRERLLHLQAERREGEALRADKERLDWLESKLYVQGDDRWVIVMRVALGEESQPLRTVIDTARAQESPP